MKRSIVILFVIALLTGGCSSILNNNTGIFGKASKQYNKIDSEIRVVETTQSKSNEIRLAQIGALAKGGVEYSLDRIKTNIPSEIVVAKRMNERIETLADKPDYKEVAAIQSIVNDLLSENDKVRRNGERLLDSKDKEIDKLQQSIKQLDNQREVHIAEMAALADANAKTTDQYKASLKSMDKFFGLGAIFYGVKRLVVSMSLMLIISAIIFLLLRILSTVNPIAASIFSIFEQMGAWIANITYFLFPKAVQLTGNVSKIYKTTLTKIVDGIQMAKANGNAVGKSPTIQEALDEIATTMSAEEKAIVVELKKTLNWK